MNLDDKKLFINFAVEIISRGGAVVARWAHNPEAAGSSPAPATNNQNLVLWCKFLEMPIQVSLFFFYLKNGSYLRRQSYNNYK